jgi:hypothetical protein
MVHHGQDPGGRYWGKAEMGATCAIPRTAGVGVSYPVTNIPTWPLRSRVLAHPLNWWRSPGHPRSAYSPSCRANRAGLVKSRYDMAVNGHIIEG